MVRAMLLAAVAALSPVVDGPSQLPAPPRPAAAPAQQWVWPLAPRPAVVRPFHAPPTPWSAGHRGVDLAAQVGHAVRSAGEGRVTFSGRVAGRGVVVVTHGDGLRTTYEPLDDRAELGRPVAAGDVIGTLSGGSGHCGRSHCLHWGLRRAASYLDPLSLLGRGPPVLLPLSRR
jgi:murein DD-endopeptidase MepM/ murein hydrolase activator NlpD